MKRRKRNSIIRKATPPRLLCAYYIISASRKSACFTPIKYLHQLQTRKCLVTYTVNIISYFLIKSQYRNAELRETLKLFRSCRPSAGEPLGSPYFCTQKFGFTLSAAPTPRRIFPCTVQEYIRSFS